jgi:hypothetical protein
MLLFLKFYLSHLLADFLLQPNSIARNKRNPGALLKHSAIHIITTLAIINFDLNFKVALAILFLAFAHAGCDYVKARFSRDGLTGFIIDQFVHLMLIACVAIYLTPNGGSNATNALRTMLRSSRVHLFLCVYVAVIFGGGYFVQKITNPFLKKIDAKVVPSKPGLPNAGKYIGWLERSLVLTLLISGYPEGIGLLLAAKALVRYPEIKEDNKAHFAEYFLIGTLTSVSLALFAGLLLRRFQSRF